MTALTLLTQKLKMNEQISILNSITSFEAMEEMKMPPSFFEGIIEAILDENDLPKDSLTPFSEGTNIVYAYGKDKVIKLFPPFHHSQFERDRLVLKHFEGRISVDLPKLLVEGVFHEWPYLIMTKLSGRLLEGFWPTLSHENQSTLMRQLGALIKEVHALPVDEMHPIDINWNNFVQHQIDNCVEHHKGHQLSPVLLAQIPDFLNDVKDELLQMTHSVLLTGEYTPMNLLVTEKNSMWHISGLIDFGDAMLGDYRYDLLGPVAFLVQGDPLLSVAFLTGYGFLSAQLTSRLSHTLTAFLLLHQYSNLSIQVRIPNWEKQVSSLTDLSYLIWGF